MRLVRSSHLNQYPPFILLCFPACLKPELGCHSPQPMHVQSASCQSDFTDVSRQIQCGRVVPSLPGQRGQNMKRLQTGHPKRNGQRHLSSNSFMRVRNCCGSSAAMAACTESASTTTHSDGACSASNSDGSSTFKCSNTWTEGVSDRHVQGKIWHIGGL